MALDNANFIAELSITDPPGSDPLSQGDDQIRTCKRSVFNSFAFIDKAVLLTADQLNLAAIKNEANLFTVSLNQFTERVIINAPTLTQFRDLTFQSENLNKWGLIVDSGNSNRFSLGRYNNTTGDFIDNCFTVDINTNVVNFSAVPTVLGAPLWVAGEIRSFVIDATPGANWFLADGTNSTHNLNGRIQINQSAFGAVGADQNASLTSVTSATGVTGSTILTTNQMPAHDHGLLGGSVTGVTAPLLAANARGVYGHGSMTPSYVFTTGFGDNLMQATGLSQGHTHTDGGNAMVIGEPGFSDSVRPLVTVVQSYQYVP